MATTATRAAVSAAHLVVLQGTITSEPERREFRSTVAVQFDVTTDVGHRLAVPVNWYDPPERDLAAIVEGEEVLVVGTVQRRFFRAGGFTQSRTEVVPASVVPLRRRKSVRSALAAAAAVLSEATGSPARSTASG